MPRGYLEVVHMLYAEFGDLLAMRLSGRTFDTSLVERMFLTALRRKLEITIQLPCPICRVFYLPCLHRNFAARATRLRVRRLVLAIAVGDRSGNVEKVGE